LSLFGYQVTYKEKLWSYESADFNKRGGSVVLKNDESTLHLFMKKKGKRLFVGETHEESVGYCKDKPLKAETGINNDVPFSHPVFREDTTIYSGFIKGYNPEISGSSIVLTFKNIISGNNYYHKIDVSANGSFSGEIPLLYPQIARISSKAYQGSVFLEPGKKMFHMIDPGTNESEYAGESAGINYDLDKLRKINSFDYNVMRQTINNMSPEHYKSYCLDNLEKDINSLDSIKKELHMTAKAYQMARMNTEYIYASHILDYDWYYRSAYREQQNLSAPVTEIPLDVDSLTTGYFDFLTDDLLNNPVGIYSDNYNAFIHSFKNIARVQPTGDYTIQSGNHPFIDFLVNLTVAGYPFTEEESDLVKGLDLTELPKIVKSYLKFFNDHQSQIHELLGKHIEIARNFNPGETGKMSLFLDVIDYMKENRIDFTDEEKVLVDAYHDFETTEVDPMHREIYKKWGGVIENFSWDYNDTYDIYHYVAGAMKRKENFQNELGVSQCMAIDVMFAQNLYAPICLDTQNPLTEDQRSSLLKLFSTQYIADYFSRFLEDRSFNSGIK